MGPPWLRIECPEHILNGVVSSYHTVSGMTDEKILARYKAEFLVKDPKLIKPFADGNNSIPCDMPPLMIMSLAMHSVVNHKLNK